MTNCVVCGREFELKRADARYCSDACMQAASRCYSNIICDIICDIWREDCWREDCIQVSRQIHADRQTERDS